VHIRRNGILEAIASDATHRNHGEPASLSYFSHDLVKYVISGLRSYLKGYAELGLLPPAYCFLSLLGVKGMYLYWPGLGRTANPVAEEDILLPPDPVQQVLRRGLHQPFDASVRHDLERRRARLLSVVEECTGWMSGSTRSRGGK